MYNLFTMEKEELLQNLIWFSKKHYYVDDLDLVYNTNYLYKEFDVYPPLKEVSDHIDDINVLVKELVSYYKNKGLDDRNAELKAIEILGRITPTPSQINDLFHKKYEHNYKEATEFLYQLGIDNYYVQKEKIDKNEEWVTTRNGKDIEITINLSKPEKNNKDIAKLLSAKQVSDYPKCALCIENLGFYGNEKKDARTNIRFAKLELNNSTWYMQYSPYGYFKEHMILFSEEHTPMVMNKMVFDTLLDFATMFPHYVIGSNAALPIVGGSILNHEHFQGGIHVFPLLRAPFKKEIKINNKDIKMYEVDYFDYTVCFVSKNKEELSKFVTKFSDYYNNYDDKSIDLISHTGETRHNVITPIVRVVNGEYYFYAILRNNRTSEEYPDGIYHVHKEYQHIKKEGIGLIEAMGRFILPARLKRQLRLVDSYIDKECTAKEVVDTDPELKDFLDMIRYCKLNKIHSKEYVNMACEEILKTVSVFKDDALGNIAKERFIESFIKTL